jgi:PTH1 family peptidyl-tRNA hydrolase
MNRVLIVGLGNYNLNNTRHNIGQLCANFLKNNLSEKDISRKEHHRELSANLSSVLYKDYQLEFIESTLPMNLSFIVINKAVQMMKPKEVILLHDELDLTLGRIKWARANGRFSHNGLKGIVNVNEIPRLRIGISRPEKGASITDYVLGEYSEKEKEIINDIVFPACLKEIKSRIR